MERSEIAVRGRRTYQCKHGHRSRRRGVRQLFPHLAHILIVLLAAAIFLTGFLFGGGGTASKSTENIPVPDGHMVQSPSPQIEAQPRVVVDSSAISEPQTESSASNIAEPQTEWKPITSDNWKLVLVNPWNSLPEDHSIQTVTLINDLQIDERCYPDLQDMMDACRADGLSPVICSAYRTWDVQEELYQDEVGEFLAQGYPQSEAETEAGKVVAVPGTSEHQLGLAVDIVDINNQLLDETQESTEVQKWLMEHSWEYGFILRYPKDKSEITGIIYEPWHYRYVGREDAEQIHALGVCLEEYLTGGN